ncbi:MAG TPA: glycosyltransferase [Tepidisphaeraceae bacterium]|nr:glycosyltransferase [Tepidisphaeraceae bacterium]
MSPELDIVIPVYNEADNIIRVLQSLVKEVRTPFRVLICYDHDEDTTLKVLAANPVAGADVQLVKNEGRGALGAVLTGFRQSTAPAVMVLPADDDYNAPRIDGMMEQFRAGCDIVCGSRFMPGGCMIGCRWLKATIVRVSAFVLHHAARLPTRDPSNGLRLFSRRVLDQIPIESVVGFAYSLELLVKCHRLRWKIGEAPLHWYERKQGTSRFRVLKWLPQYWIWFRYAFATTYLGRGPETVVLRDRK